MRNFIYRIDKIDVEDIVLHHFLKISGINKEGMKYCIMKKDATNVKNLITDRVNLRALISYHEEIKLENDTIFVEGQEFKCNAFELLNKNCIKGVYLYILTAGDYYLEEEPIMKQLYADLWGTSYVDASREVLEIKLLEDYKNHHIMSTEKEDVQLSNSFGPGFYGMQVQQMKDFFALLNADSINVELRGSNIIVPLKSCAGLYLIVNNQYIPPAKECETCLGTTKNCNLCKVKNPVSNQAQSNDI